MTDLWQCSASPFWRRFVGAMLHSLWQGAALVIAAWVWLRVSSPRSAQARRPSEVQSRPRRELAAGPS